MKEALNARRVTQPSEDVRWKFREPNQRTLSMLINRELWFANAEELNDPFEMNFEYYKKFEATLEAANYIDEKRKGIIRATLQRIRKRLDSEYVAVLSLCQTYHPTPMWSYYAKDHSGVALGFEFDGKKRDRDNGFNGFANLGVTSETEVRYLDFAGKQIAFDQLFEEYNQILEQTLNNPIQLISDMMAQQMIELAAAIKGPGWSHEKEKRHFQHRNKKSLSGTGKYFGEAQPFLDSELKHVVFGLKCDEEYKKTIKRILSDYDSPVQLWKAKKDTRRLIMQIEHDDP